MRTKLSRWVLEPLFHGSLWGFLVLFAFVVVWVIAHPLSILVLALAILLAVLLLRGTFPFHERQ